MAINGAAKKPTEKGDISQIGLQIGNLCKTTGWHNNCGLNSLTHFLYAKLSSLSEEELNAFLLENREYDNLLNSFHEYYGLKKRYAWRDVLQLLQAHPVATDQEAILAPVLRLHLGKVLKEHAAELWLTDGSSAISEYLQSGQVRDVAQPVYQAMKAFLDQLRQQFEAELIFWLQTEAPSQEELQIADRQLRANVNNVAKGNYEPTQQEILEHVIFQRRFVLEENYLNLAQAYWSETGCQRFADIVANMNQHVMVSADHLQFICQKLNIGLEVYTPASIQSALDNKQRAEYTRGAQSVLEGMYQWTMKVHNRGAHWTYQEPDNNKEKVLLHNRHYPQNMTADFLSNSALSGEFKIYGSAAMSKEVIIAEIKNRLGELTKEELQAIKQAEQVAKRTQAEMTLKACLQTPARHACGLLTDIHSALDTDGFGKEYIKLFASDLEIIKTLNQHFNKDVARSFLKTYGNEKSFGTIRDLNPLSKLAFLQGFATKMKSVMTAQPLTQPHSMQEALMVPSARMLQMSTQPSIKLTHLAIMTNKELLKSNAMAAEIAIKAIEANQEVTDAFNSFSTECVQKFALHPNLGALVPRFVALKPEQQVQFLQKFSSQSSAQPAPILKSTLPLSM